MAELLPALTDLPLAGYDQLRDVPGARSFTPAQVRRWVLQRGAADFDAMTDLAKGLRTELAARYRVRRGALHRSHASGDGTLGLVMQLDDGQVIESVSIPESSRHTLCISSQIGCGVACAFCASGLDGVIRNLSLGEILEQIFVAREATPDTPLTNYVFMGSGEPTHNLKAVLAAIEVMCHPDGLGIGARRITVSTIGHPAALEKLAEVPTPFGIALSMHMPTDSGRIELMPGLGTSDLKATLAAARKRFEATGRRVTIEVVVIAGVNDRDTDARDFVRLLRGEHVAVNLIPWNPVDGIPFAPASDERIDALLRILRGGGITTTVRRPRGRDVGVACGQLRRRALSG